MSLACRVRDSKKSRQRGTQVLEFALVLPLLVLLSMCIIEGGWFIRIHQVINNAAREGARVASAPNNGRFINASYHNVLGETAACEYLKQNRAVFPGWEGSSCTDPFSITVDQVQAGDPDQILVTDPETGNTELIDSTRAVVQYQYEMRYVPLVAFFTLERGPLLLKGRAQFRNLY